MQKFSNRAAPLKIRGGRGVMNRYIYNDPTTELSTQAQHDARGNNPPLSPYPPLF
jgi:hypothetical protein